MSEELQESVEETQTDEVQVQPEQEQPQEAATRPDWLPEKFNSEEDFAKSYKHLEQRLHSRSDKFKQEIMEELQSEVAGDIPETPQDYVLSLVDESGESVEIDPEDNMLQWFQGVAHNLNLNQEQFNTIVSEYTQHNAMTGPDWNVESEKLGEHSERRHERVDAWASSHLSEEAYNVFSEIPASAGMVQFFEEVMELNGQPKFNMTSEATFQEDVTANDLKAAIADPKYWKERDPVHIAKVQAMSKKIGLKKHGTASINQM